MKKLIAIILVLAMIFVLCSCNRTLFDTQYHFNYAIISLPNGDVVEGKVESWHDFEDGDQLQVKIKGIVYLVHSSNIVLMEK